MLLFGCLTQAASESNFRKLSAARAMVTPTCAQKCQSLRIGLLRFDVNSCMNVHKIHKWVHYTHTTHARFKNWQGRGIIVARQGFHEFRTMAACLRRMSVLAFTLDQLWLSCFRNCIVDAVCDHFKKSLSTEEAMGQHSGGDCEQPSGQHKA